MAKQLSSSLRKQHTYAYLMECLEGISWSIGRYVNLIQQYEISLERLLNDIMPLDQLHMSSQSIRLSIKFMTLIPSKTEEVPRVFKVKSRVKTWQSICYDNGRF